MQDLEKLARSATAKAGPAPLTGIVNRLAHLTAESQRDWQQGFVAQLWRGEEPAGQTERYEQYCAALTMLIAMVAAIDPAQRRPDQLALALTLVKGPGHVTMDPPGAAVMRAVDWDPAGVVAVRVLHALADTVATFQRQSRTARYHAAYRALVAACGVLTDRRPDLLAADLLAHRDTGTGGTADLRGGGGGG